METMDERQKRAHEAGLRLAATEVEVAASLLARIGGMSGARERAKSLKEARITIELASRLVRIMPVADARGEEIREQVGKLRERLNQLTVMFPERSARRARPRGMSRSL